MNNIAAAALLVLFGPAGVRCAQSPNGTIAGVVTDGVGGAVAGAPVTITNRDTQQARRVTTSATGAYSAPALSPARYRVSAQVSGFKQIERDAVVETGTTTTVDLALEVGEVRDTVIVRVALPLIRNDHHHVGGVTTRTQIESLPLNGRNFLELVKLEPGMTDPVRGTNNRIFVAVLGAGLQANPRVGYTRVTVDGANINSIGAIGASLQVSQELVQEFQVSTVNFDQSTGLTSNGSINIVTRSGGNDHHGSAFFFHRDQNLAAYPGLRRDATNPRPLFQRHQAGFQHGGPIQKDRAFFFTSYERHHQRGVVSVLPRTPEFAPLGGIFPSPYSANQVSGRVDWRLTSRNSAFARYTYDGNRAFAPLNDRTDLLPSAWSRLANRADQTLAAVTSVFSMGVVSDFRLSSFSLDSPLESAGSEDCDACFGLGAPLISIPDAEVTFGKQRTLSLTGRRYQAAENVTWQKGRHRFRFGFDWEHASTTTSSITHDPAQLMLWAPARVRQLAPSIPLPDSFITVEDVLRLPLQSFQTGVGPGVILQRGFSPIRVFDLYRLYGSDTWRVSSSLTINYGLGWSYEPNVLNHDLTKPALLIPLLGGDLNPPPPEADHFSPAIGFAWNATGDGRTVLRGGAGRYFDPVGSVNPLFLGSERSSLLPLGTGRLIESGSNLRCNGHTLAFTQPTSFTGAQLLSCLSDIRANLFWSLNPANRSFALRNIDRTKEGANLLDPSFSTPYAVHVALGAQRQFARNFAVTADVVWRRFVHTFITGIDYNRWNSAAGPVIPRCAPEQRTDLLAACSNGSITFDTTIGRARYLGLLVRVDKRFSRPAQFRASYALSTYTGTNGTGAGTGFDNDDRLRNHGPLPTDLRHVLNVSAALDLPWQFRLAVNLSALSRPPFSAVVLGVDFDGDGTRGDLLPGTTVNQFNRGHDREDLARLVDRYNQEVAGRSLCCNQAPAPTIALPASYSFNDRFFTLDVRLGPTFVLRRDAARVHLFAEVFNLLNTANLVQYGDNIGNSATFGQAGVRFAQVFGSGGPRAAQLGARVSF